MKRKLLFLNCVLLALIGVAAWRIHAEWNTQKLREQALRNRRVVPPRSPQPVIALSPAPVTAAAYSDIATKMLFSKDRNPTVVVEVSPAPPPKPMPPLPLLHGVMGLPSGMLALMSLKADGRSTGVKVGDKIGEFQLAALSRDEISFKWEDKTVTKSVSEMIYHAQDQVAVAPAAAIPASTPAAAASATPPPPPAQNGKPAADVVGAQGMKSCVPGDTSPNGTIADGYKKVLVPTPFGNSCHWEPAK